VARPQKHRKAASSRAVDFHGTKRERAIYDRVLKRNTA
jgi:hypothetical protein